MLVFERKQRHYTLRGRALCPPKLSRGQCENPAYTPRRETTCLSANIPPTQLQRERFGRRFNRKRPRTSFKNNKLTNLVRTCSRGYDDTYATFEPRHETLSVYALCTKLPPVMAHITQSMQEESVWKSLLCGQRNRLR